MCKVQRRFLLGCFWAFIPAAQDDKQRILVLKKTSGVLYYVFQFPLGSSSPPLKDLADAIPKSQVIHSIRFVRTKKIVPKA